MDFLLTLLFYQIEPYKKGPFLVLPSSIGRNLSTRCTNPALSEKLPKWHFLTLHWIWKNIFALGANEFLHFAGRQN